MSCPIQLLSEIRKNTSFRAFLNSGTGTGGISLDTDRFASGIERFSFGTDRFILGTGLISLVQVHM